MIAWSIEAALKSECFDEVWVSTDDQEIADIAVKFGAKVPFLRPAHLSDDYATTADVMQHAIQAFAQLRVNRQTLFAVYMRQHRLYRLMI